MLSFLKGDNLAAQAIREYDWANSPLGVPKDWPVALKTIVGLILGSRFPQCVVWGPSLIAIPNNAFRPILGDKPALGRPFSEIWSEVWFSLEPIVEKAFAGEATYVEDFPLTINRHGYPERAFFTFCYSPIRDEQGQIVGMLDTVHETTDKVQLHERQRLLSSELGHRLKNLLSVVQAIASQTLRQAPDLETANSSLAARLSAFGRAADLLIASEWNDADLSALVKAVLTTYGSAADRFRIEGPSIRFKSQVALAIALALHELTTNAIKYGALSNDTGHVDLSWFIEGGPNPLDERFILTWREVGGPLVSPPAKRGFGSILIERSLRSSFRGETSISYNPEGLLLKINAPLAGAKAEGVP